MQIDKLDLALIGFFKRVSMPVARVGLFVVFFYFGLLKVLGLSPASDLVRQLFEETISFMSFDSFFIMFGLFECLIGLMFIIPGLERAVIPLLFLHMLSTFMPLFILPEATWSSFMVPTLEGQYIIKNLVIIASAIFIASSLRPFSEKSIMAS